MGRPAPAWRVGAGLLIAALLANWCYVLGSLRELESERGATAAQTAVPEGSVENPTWRVSDSSQTSARTME